MLLKNPLKNVLKKPKKIYPMLRPQLLKLSVEAPVMKNLNVLFKKSLLSVMMLNANDLIKPLRKNE